MTKSVADDIDWTKIPWKAECTCKCGEVFQSAAKYYGLISRMVSKEPCPSCGSHVNLRRVSSSPQRFTIRN